MRELHCNLIMDAVRQLWVEANTVMPPDIRSALERAMATEESPLGRELLERYSAEDAEPMAVDRREIELLGAEVVFRPLMDMECGYARHSGVKVAQAVVELYQQRADTKIF